MIQSFIEMMMMLMGLSFFAVIGGGIWMLYRSNGGNNPINRAVEEFRSGTPINPGRHTTIIGESPLRYPEVLHPNLHSPSMQDSPKRPVTDGEKIMAVVFLVMAGLYLLSPLDFIPDLIPGICHVDDIGVVGLAVRNAFKRFAA